MDENKNFVVYIDILGFDEQMKQIEKIHQVPSWRARTNVLEKVSDLIKVNSIYNKYAKMSPDSWILLFDGICPLMKYLYDFSKSIKKEYTLISLEICVNYGDIECDDYWLTDDAIEAINDCKKYREYYRQENLDYPRKSFTLFTAKALKELKNFILKHDIFLNFDQMKIDNMEIYTVDIFFLIEKLGKLNQFNELKNNIKNIIKSPAVETESISIIDAAHLGDTFVKLIKSSNEIDLYLYTAESFAITYYEILLQHPGIEFRILTRHPESDERKKDAAERCILLWNDIAKKNKNCKISMRLYRHNPLLRSIVFDRNEGFLSIYRYTPAHPFLFVGVESNKLIHVKKDTSFGQYFLDLYQSRFEFDWESADIIQIPAENSL
jgi:hypothetical protein